VGFTDYYVRVCPKFENLFVITRAHHMINKILKLNIGIIGRACVSDNPKPQPKPSNLNITKRPLKPTNKG
jgi:hypothetical protein